MIGDKVLDAIKRSETETIGFQLWVSFAICFLCNVSAGLISTLMAGYLPVVVRDLSGDVSADQLNQVSAYIQSLYIAGWAMGGFMWGFISDRIGRVRAIVFSVFTFGLATFAISFAPSWEWVVAFRLLSGLTIGGIMVITPTLLFEIWPVKTRAVIIGIDSIGFPIGIFSSGLVNINLPDWRQGFFVGLVPIALAILSLRILKESDDWQKSKSKTAVKPALATSADKANLLKGAIIFGSMLIGLWGMFSWIPTWVQSLLTNSEGTVERGASLMLLGGGGLIGGFLSGFVSNSIGVRRALLFCFTGCLIMSVLLFGTNATFSPVIYVELALLSLFFGISQGLLAYYIPQLFPVNIRGTFTGICFNIGRIPTAIAILFVGLLVTALGGYSNTLLTFAGIFVIGFITVALTSYNKNKEQA